MQQPVSSSEFDAMEVEVENVGVNRFGRGHRGSTSLRMKQCSDEVSLMIQDTIDPPYHRIATIRARNP